MNPAAARIVLRQRGLLETLDLALRFVPTLGGALYRRLFLLVVMPGLALASLAWWLGLPAVFVWVLCLVLGGQQRGVFTLGAGQLVFSDSVATSAVLREYRRRLPALLHAKARSWGTVVPFFAPSTAFLDELVLLEGCEPRRVRARGAALVGAQGDVALGVRVVGWGAVVVTIIAAELIVDFLVNDLLGFGRPFGDLFTDGLSLVALATYFCAQPFLATTRLLAYVNLRTLADGWDIQVRMLAARAAAAERVA